MFIIIHAITTYNSYQMSSIPPTSSYSYPPTIHMRYNTQTKIKLKNHHFITQQSNNEASKINKQHTFNRIHYDAVTAHRIKFQSFFFIFAFI